MRPGLHKNTEQEEGVANTPSLFGAAPGHLPLTHTECQPPAATLAIRRPCSASNSLGSGSASSDPWPSCPCLIKGVPNQLQVGPRVRLLELRHITPSPVLTCPRPRRTPDQLRTAAAHAQHPAPAGGPVALGPEAGRRVAPGSHRHGRRAATAGSPS